jgi:heat shock protein HslJ
MRFTTLITLIFLLLSCGEGTPSQDNASTQATAPTLPVKESVDTALAGSWELVGLPQSSVSFDKLYPRQHPIIFIQPDLRLISGSTGCNRFSASLSTLGNRLTFTGFTSSTLQCVGDAESNFLSAWKQAATYRFRQADELVWGTDSLDWMVFRRK